MPEANWKRFEFWKDPLKPKAAAANKQIEAIMKAHPDMGKPGASTDKNKNVGMQQTNNEPPPLVDPLSVQLFFANTIAPYLDKVSGSMKGEADQYAQMMHGLLSGGAKLPDQYRGVMEAAIPQQQTSMKMMADAMAGSALAGPALDQLMNAINQARNTQYKAYLEALKSQTFGTGGGGGDLASIMATLGVNPSGQ
jgi:hypothetical protein